MLLPLLISFNNPAKAVGKVKLHYMAHNNS